MRTVIPCHCLVNLREAAIAQQNQYFLRENTVVQPWGGLSNYVIFSSPTPHSTISAAS